MPHVVILGAGFAGTAAVRALERTLHPDEAELTIVSRENFTLFTPLLPEVLAGGIETRHAVTPVRAQVKRARFVLAEVVRLDPIARAIEVVHTITGTRVRVEYDQLVLALGSVTSTFGIPGVDEYALPLKTLEDAARLRNRIIATLEAADVERDAAERARLSTFAIVGGGYTGCEAAGELRDLFGSIVRFYRHVDPDEVRIVLIEAGRRLLPDLPDAMAAYTFANLTARGVEVVVGDGVSRLDARELQLASGRTIPTSTVIWSAGVRPPPFLREVSFPHARNGAIVAGRDMSVVGWPGVWAIGDCAWIPTRTRDVWYPMTAQHALREGRAVAGNIAATLRGRPTAPFDFVALGTMASLGGRRGVAALANGTILTGFLAWFVWRSYYLFRLPGLDRKLRVALDWTLALLFPRDIAELRVLSNRK